MLSMRPPGFSSGLGVHLARVYWESVFLRRPPFDIVTHGESSLPTFGAAFFHIH